MRILATLAVNSRKLCPGRLEATKRLTSTMTSPVDALAGFDPEQARLMAERVILVDPQDKVVGSMSKKDAHLVSNDLPLHRAFSVFLFDTKGRMLLQQRAAEKITFPSYWTNTVCSHPLFTPAELGQNDDNDEVIGAKRAALRKLSHELGVKEGDVELEDLQFMTRIRYRAESDGGVWGEHEVDYVFMAMKDVKLDPEPNEVRAVKYVTQADLKDMFRDAESPSNLRLTPWFRHIVEGFAWSWWDTLLVSGFKGLANMQDVKNVHAMGKCDGQGSPQQLAPSS